MGVKKVYLGKIVADHLGYKIRIMLESKSKESKDRAGKVIRTSSMSDSGKLGVYAGKKKLVKEGFISKSEALNYINELTNKKK